MELRWPAQRRTRLVVASVLAVELTWISWHFRGTPIDLRIYLWGGHAVTHGTLLYAVRAYGHWYTNSPFSAAFFWILASIPAALARAVWAAASLAGLAVGVWISLRLAGREPTRRVLAGAVAAGLLLEPVWRTLSLGQVNLILFALILADVKRIAAGKNAGIGIGIATAVKLTPGIFIALLLLTRRWRSAAIAGVAFAVCTGLGALVARDASTRYWTHLFFDTSRVGAPFISNQSPYGAAERVLGAGQVGPWFVVVSVVFAVVGLATASYYGRRDRWLEAAAVAAVTGLLVSPVSWTHHWVWVIPALLVLLRLQPRAAALGFVLFVAAPMWWTPHMGGPDEYGWHYGLTLVANCYLLAGAAFVGGMAVAAYREQRSRPASSAQPAGGPSRMLDLRVEEPEHGATQSGSGGADADDRVLPWRRTGTAALARGLQRSRDPAGRPHHHGRRWLHGELGLSR